MSEHRIYKLGEQLIIRGDHEGNPDNTLSKIMHGLAQECATEEPSFIGITPTGSRTKSYQTQTSDYDLAVTFDAYADAEMAVIRNLIKIINKFSLEFQIKHSLNHLDIHLIPININLRRILALVAQKGPETSFEMSCRQEELAKILSSLFGPSTVGKMREYQIKTAQTICKCFDSRELSDFLKVASASIADIELGQYSQHKIISRANMSETELNRLRVERKGFWFRHLSKYIPARAKETSPKK